ncbi:sodium:sulfate symporter transmembrane region domain-containing protein [Ditylenchus destructor]|uniref:Sodium:sulfate symporter transmembrane region domain-containing protein n=1 Tax=Ditylenchus destructor TaxID=166010 RepID=A0AAD4N4N9_9BILA|nr:sodium:sulfate symporter transmembrane region domain-containing protein [Ditylenchus destructor]
MCCVFDRLIIFARLWLCLLPILSQTKESLCAFVLILMGFLWITETIPLAATALLPVVLYPLFGIITAEETSQEYMTDTVFILMGSLIMGIAVQITNLHERIALRILLLTGTSPRWIMLGFQLSSSLISMWMSNTGTTAMMIPILMKVICELERCYRLENECDNKLDRILASYESEDLDEAELLNADPKHLKIYKGLLLCVAYSATIGGVGTLIGSGPQLVLMDHMNKLYPRECPLTFVNWMLFGMPAVILMELFCWMWLQVLFIGFRKDNKEAGESVHRTIRKRYENLGSLRYFSFAEISVLACFVIEALLWATSNPGFVSGWDELFPKAGDCTKNCKYVTNGTVAISVALLLFIIPRENPFGSQPGVGSLSPILTWPDVHKHFSWGTMIMIAGSFAMSRGVEKSELNHVLENQLRTFSENLPELLFISLAALMAAILTDFASNTAAASILLPVLEITAKSKKVNPLLYSLPTVLCCSFDFMLPAGNPPNAIVFSTGLLRIREMACAGLVLNCFGLVLSIAMTCSGYAEWVFSMKELPAGWVNSSTQIPLQQYS